MFQLNIASQTVILIITYKKAKILSLDQELITPENNQFVEHTNMIGKENQPEKVKRRL